ncbi:vegetative incompatibility protein HET-E-1 [Panicum miliaceum]|uniref:Vegetative incompatibility protein HET-E-1 n=1 Tax=Panicum miliaceum TaxID=4540 RepID=A0A3L6QTS1_PANMI|nr:vegetative incompatibility protein HET-E-1 [Panicum miliaceum]
MSTTTASSAAASPFAMSPWAQLPSLGLGAGDGRADNGRTGLLGSLVKADGHVYSLSAAGDLLYTGMESQDMRVWRTAASSERTPDGRIYTSHQDGKVRVWRASTEDPAAWGPSRGSGTCSGSRRRRNGLWMRHFDTVLALCLDATTGLIYSGSSTPTTTP